MTTPGRQKSIWERTLIGPFGQGRASSRREGADFRAMADPARDTPPPSSRSRKDPTPQGSPPQSSRSRTDGTPQGSPPRTGRSRTDPTPQGSPPQTGRSHEDGDPLDHDDHGGEGSEGVSRASSDAIDHEDLIHDLIPANSRLASARSRRTAAGTPGHPSSEGHMEIMKMLNTPELGGASAPGTADPSAGGTPSRTVQ